MTVVGGVTRTTGARKVNTGEREQAPALADRRRGRDEDRDRSGHCASERV